MANAPEKKIDELLKSYAQQRRKEASPPLEMPEATRRALQVEVARTFQKPKAAEPPAWWRLFSGFWPRLAFGAGLLAALVVTAVLSMRPDHKLQDSFQLAQNSDREQANAPGPIPPASAPEASDRNLSLARNDAAPPTTVPSPTTERELERASAPVERERLARTGSEVTLLTLNSRALDDSTLAKDKATLGRKVEERSAPLASSKTLADRPANAEAKGPTGPGGVLVAKAPDARALSVSNAGEPSYFQGVSARGLAEQESSASRLQFSQVDARPKLRYNRNSPPRITNVLNSFQVQRQGSKILVFDADGSVYEGTVQSLPQDVSARAAAVTLRVETARSVLLQQRAEPGPAQNLDSLQRNRAEGQASENFSFSAVGTNRSLNQKVVFTGNYLNFRNALPSGGGFGGGGQGAAPSQGIANGTSAPQAPAQNAALPLTTATRGGSTQQFQFLQNEWIEGKASVGKTEFPIAALRVQPNPSP